MWFLVLLSSCIAPHGGQFCTSGEASHSIDDGVDVQRTIMSHRDSESIGTGLENSVCRNFILFRLIVSITPG